MFIPRIYLEAEYQIEQHVTLDNDHFHYLAHVLRAKKGDQIILWNNDGTEYECVIELINKKNLSIVIQNANSCNRESPCQIELMLPLMVHEKVDWAIQKSVELGVSTITPTHYQRSKVKLNEERLNKKYLHWKKLIESAANQSGRTKLPTLNPAIDFQQSFNQNMPILFFAPNQNTQTPPPTNHQGPCQIYIGPESGYSEQEINSAIAANAHFIQLGPRILRAETAVVSAMTYTQMTCGDFC